MLLSVQQILVAGEGDNCLVSSNKNNWKDAKEYGKINFDVNIIFQDAKKEEKHINTSTPS